MINVKDIKYNDGLKKGIIYPSSKDQIMSVTYSKYINTPEFIKHIGFNWFKRGVRTLLLAPTGTGKTTCVIEEVIRRYKEEGVSALIVAPLTDLVIQISSTINYMAGEVISDGILGKSTSISDNHNDSLGNKWRESEGLIRIISSASLYDLYKNADTRDLIRDYFKQLDSVLIVDEFSSIVNDENYKKEECENLKCIMDMAEDNRCPVITMDATATEFDITILKNYDVYDFRDKIDYGKDFTIKILNIEGKDKKQVDKERIELMLNHVREGGTVLMRRNSKDGNKAEAELINELYGSDICYNIDSDNKRSKRNSFITDSIYKEKIIPKECKILLTTSLLDKGISINNPNLLPIFLDGPDNTPEQLVQFISRARKSDSAVFIPYNKKSNILGGSLEDKFEIARKYKARLMKALNTLTNDDRDVCDKSNILTKEFDDLLNVWKGGKDISKIAVARLINATVNKVCSVNDKLELASKYRTNIVTEYIGGEPKDDKLTEEELEIIESMNSVLKEKRKIKKQEVKEFINEMCTLETLSFSTACGFLYNYKYLPDNFMIENKVSFDKREDSTLEYDLSNTVKIAKELQLEHGVIEFNEALKCSLNCNNIKYAEVQLHSDINKVINGKFYGKDYESKNGGLVKDLYTCIYKIANIIINNKAMIASEVDKLIDKTLSTDIKLDYNLFPLSKRQIKSILFKITDNKEVVNRNKEGKNVKKTLFISIKSKQQIYNDYVLLLNSLGVTKVKSLETMICGEELVGVIDYQPF